MSAWADHAIWWHISPLGFTGAPITALPADGPVQHRLRHLSTWLDYVVEQSFLIKADIEKSGASHDH